MMRAMRWLSLSLLVAVSAGCATRSSIDAERLQGNWTVVAVQRNGVPDAGDVGSFLFFAGREVHFVPNLIPLMAKHQEKIRDAALR